MKAFFFIFCHQAKKRENNFLNFFRERERERERGKKSMKKATPKQTQKTKKRKKRNLPPPESGNLLS